MKNLSIKTHFTKLSVALLAASLFIGCTKNDREPVNSSLSVISSDSEGVKAGSIINNLKYANVTDYRGRNENLTLDIYFATGVNSATKSPLIVFFHGGGYVSGDKASTKYDCQILAAQGYNVASVNYRLGYRQVSKAICNPYNVPGAMEAFYRAQQDAAAALRYLVNNAVKYSIDTSWIFVEGQSSGAVIALSLVYYTQDSLDYYLPGISDTLGLIKNHGNNLTNTYTFKGIGSMWGGILFTANILTQKNTIPTIFFHGELDGVVPFNIAPLYCCSCFPLDYGSKPLYDQCVKYNVPSVMHVDPLGAHGVYDSNFNESNIACFFTSIMAGHPQSGYYTTKVTNCN